MHIWKSFQVQAPLLAPDEGGGGGGDIGGQGGNSHLQEDLALLNDDGDDGAGDDDGTGDGSDDSDPDARRGRRGRVGAQDDRRGNTRGEGEDENGEGDVDEDADPDAGDEDEGEEDEGEEDQEGEQDDEEDDKDKPPQRVLGRPTIQQIRAAGGKDIFKTLPGLRDIFFSEQKYREHIADPEQAAEFVEKAQHFDMLEGDLIAGSPKLMLDQLREGSPDAYKKVAENFLPTLRTMDPTLYTQLTFPVIRELLFHAHNYGKSRGGAQGDNIMKSAEWLSDFVFQNGGKIEPMEEPKGKHPAEIALEQERQKQSTEKHTAAMSDVNGRIERALVGIITEGMPASLNKFVKNAILEKTLDEMVAGIPGDKPFMMKIKGLWSRARLAQYPEASKKAIVDAQIARARTVAREIRDRLVKEAQGGQPRRQRSGDDEGQDRNRDRNQDRNNNRQGGKKRNFESQGGRSGGRGQSGGRETVLDSSKIDYSRTSDADILSGDRTRVKLRNR